jgi:hypothetical protein
MFDELEHPQQRAFLSAYAELGTVKRAAKVAGISRETHYEWKRSQPAYAQAFLEARAMAGGALEDEAVKRARYGVSDYVLFMGQVVEYNGRPLKKRRYSDPLLLRLLTSHLPDLYSDKREIVQSGEVKHSHQHQINYSAFSDHELELLEQLLIKGKQPVESGSGASGTRSPQALPPASEN